MEMTPPHGAGVGSLPRDIDEDSVVDIGYDSTGIREDVKMFCKPSKTEFFRLRIAMNEVWHRLYNTSTTGLSSGKGVGGLFWCCIGDAWGLPRIRPRMVWPVWTGRAAYKLLLLIVVSIMTCGILTVCPAPSFPSAHLHEHPLVVGGSEAKDPLSITHQVCSVVEGTLGFSFFVLVLGVLIAFVVLSDMATHHAMFNAMLSVVVDKGAESSGVNSVGISEDTIDDVDGYQYVDMRDDDDDKWGVRSQSKSGVTMSDLSRLIDLPSGPGSATNRGMLGVLQKEATMLEARVPQFFSFEPPAGASPSTTYSPNLSKAGDFHRCIDRFRSDLRYGVEEFFESLSTTTRGNIAKRTCLYRMKQMVVSYLLPLLVIEGLLCIVVVAHMGVDVIAQHNETHAHDEKLSPMLSVVALFFILVASIIFLSCVTSVAWMRARARSLAEVVVNESMKEVDEELLELWWDGVKQHIQPSLHRCKLDIEATKRERQEEEAEELQKQQYHHTSRYTSQGQHDDTHSLASTRRGQPKGAIWQKLLESRDKQGKHFDYVVLKQGVNQYECKWVLAHHQQAAKSPNMMTPMNETTSNAI